MKTLFHWKWRQHDTYWLLRQLLHQHSLQDNVFGIKLAWCRNVLRDELLLISQLRQLRQLRYLSLTGPNPAPNLLYSSHYLRFVLNNGETCNQMLQTGQSNNWCSPSVLKKSYRRKKSPDWQQCGIICNQTCCHHRHYGSEDPVQRWKWGERTKIRDSGAIKDKVRTQSPWTRVDWWLLKQIIYTS